MPKYFISFSYEGQSHNVVTTDDQKECVYIPTVVSHFVFEGKNLNDAMVNFLEYFVTRQYAERFSIYILSFDNIEYKEFLSISMDWIHGFLAFEKDK